MSEEYPPTGDPIEADYRPLSIAAVASVAFGLTAFLTLINQALVIFPLLALAFAAYAYLRIQNSDQPLDGTRLILIGVAMTVFVTSTGLTYGICRDNRMYGYARQHAEHWFDLIQKKDFFRLHQLTIHPESRVNVNRDDHLAAFYDENFVLARPRDGDPEKPVDQLKELLQTDPVVSLLHMGDRVTLRFIGRDTRSYFRQLDREVFSVVFEMNPSPYQRRQPMVFGLMLERRRFPAPVNVQWRVTQRKYISGGPDQELIISSQ